jgi:adenylate kinase
MKLIMLGAPGAGKGTISEMVQKKYLIPQISTGDLLRDAVKNRTDLGLSAKQFMDRGELVPDDIVLKLLQQRIAKADCTKGFILDGFPRNKPQAEALGRMGISVDKVINFKIKESIILERLAGRRTCKDCEAIFNIKTAPPKVKGICDKCGGQLYQREDQKPEVVRERLKTYSEQTEPLIGYYNKKGLLADIDAAPSPEKIFAEVEKVLKSIAK